MRPCQQGNGDCAVGVWMSALLIFILVIAWKHWPRMGWAGRVGILAACIAMLGGLAANSYWGDNARSTGGTCGTCVTPSLPSPSSGPSTRSAMVTTKAASQPRDDSSSVATSPEVVAYYFHRTIRCPSCVQIEEWAKQAIENRFANEIMNGLVEWRAVNIQEAGNEHFEKDYELTGQSLVLVRMKDGQPVESKNLTSVWELLGDYAGFTKYVQTEVSSFLGGASGT